MLHHPEQRPEHVLTIRDAVWSDIVKVCGLYTLNVQRVDRQHSIPGSFWGDQEAGLRDDSIYVRDDTPLHSLLHEACHFICMSAERRGTLDTNAGGDYAEENAVCYLQILLADRLPPLNRARIMADMDTWGYSFRLGSASRWFYDDADDARRWLLGHGLIDELDNPTGQLRQT